MSGDRTAVDLAVQAAGEPEVLDEPEQMDLLGLPETYASRELAQRRGPGRPPGSRNKRTVQMVEFLLRRYADPREVLLQIGQASVEELAAKLGCTALEALQEKRLALSVVLPYVAQRQPLAVDVTNRQVVYLTINETAPAAPDGSNGIGFTAHVVDVLESEEKQ